MIGYKYSGPDGSLMVLQLVSVSDDIGIVCFSRIYQCTNKLFPIFFQIKIFANRFFGICHCSVHILLCVQREHGVLTGLLVIRNLAEVVLLDTFLHLTVRIAVHALL
jgi:hypothetical protein